MPPGTLPAAPSAVAKIWKQPESLSREGWIKKTWCLHTIKYHSAFKKKETLPFTTWIKLEDIMLSEKSQSQTDKYCTTV